MGPDLGLNVLQRSTADKKSHSYQIKDRANSAGQRFQKGKPSHNDTATQ